MKVREALRRSAVAIAPEQTVRTAAQVMRSSGVGTLVVVDEAAAPVGIVTDRDLVTRALAADVPADARIDAVMTTPVVTVAADADLHSCFRLFRVNAVRRLVVVDGATFAGVVSVDDLLVDLVGDLGDVVRPVTAETLFGQHDAAVPATA